MTITIRRRYSFDAYLRTGRLIAPGGVEHKFNPNHDPDTGRFAFADGGGSSLDTAGGGSRRDDGSRPRTTLKKVSLTPEEYNRQASSLWGDMEGPAHTGFENQAQVDQALRSQQAKSAGQRASASLPKDLEAPEDVRKAVASVANATISASIQGNQEFEKTLTFERGTDGEVKITSLGLSGKQGGHPPGITQSTIAIAHVHYAGLDQPPFGLDNTGPRAGKYSFVIGGERGQVWEIGRQSGKDVQRIINKGGSAGRWAPFGR